MARNFGVRWRLLLAFFGISAFALAAAVAALYAFSEVGLVLDRITRQRVPAALASLRLSRQAERVIATAPALLAATSKAQHELTSTDLALEVEHLAALLEELASDVDLTNAHDEIEKTVLELRGNLRALDTLVAERLSVSARKEELLRRLSSTTTRALRVTAPGILDMDESVSAWRQALDEPDVGEDARSKLSVDVARVADAFLPQQKAQIEISTVNGTLFKVASADSPAVISKLAHSLSRSLFALEALAPRLDAALRDRLMTQLQALRELAEGPDSIRSARNKKLTSQAEGERLLKENSALSRQLSSALDTLVGSVQQDIENANLEAASVQRVSTGILALVVVLSLASSTLIVWRYVGRNVIARLTALSQSMLAIADGRLRVPLPPAGDDEIGRMARALQSFRDTAVEIEEKNLREVAAARSRLVNAIESNPDGFALFDSEDRLVLSNTQYRQLLYPAREEAVTPEMTFQSIVARATTLGLIADIGDDPDEWLGERLEQHRNPSGVHLQRRANGRWIQIGERRTGDGDTVAVYTDISRSCAWSACPQRAGTRY